MDVSINMDNFLMTRLSVHFFAIRLRFSGVLVFTIYQPSVTVNLGYRRTSGSQITIAKPKIL